MPNRAAAFCWVLPWVQQDLVLSGNLGALEQAGLLLVLRNAQPWSRAAARRCARWMPEASL